MKYLKKRIGVFLATLLFVIGGFTGLASADNLILCSLWAGSNFDVSNGLNCNNTSASTNNSATLPNNTSQNNSGHTIPPPVMSNNAYVALGDSVAAGLGLPLNLNATAQDQQCGRSPQGYPNVVAANLGLTLVNKTCSGATVGDLVTQERIRGPNPSAQLNNTFANGTPQLITITAGANDAHWADFIRTCYQFNCDTAGYTTAANTLLLTMQAKLRYALSDLAVRSGGNPPQVIVTGYYDPLSASCVLQQQQITSNEVTWLSNETAKLNQKLATTSTQFPFVTFVPIDFTGHDICSSDPWVQGPTAAAPFHPTAEGQQAIASDVLSAVR